MDFHVELGMAFVLQVGSPESFAPMPPKFPQCGDWKGVSDSPKEIIDSVRKKTTNLKHQIY